MNWHFDKVVFLMKSTLRVPFWNWEIFLMTVKRRTAKEWSRNHVLSYVGVGLKRTRNHFGLLHTCRTCMKRVPSIINCLFLEGRKIPLKIGTYIFIISVGHDFYSTSYSQSAFLEFWVTAKFWTHTTGLKVISCTCLEIWVQVCSILIVT